jgi:L-fuculose-phosphate aldolase
MVKSDARRKAELVAVCRELHALDYCPWTSGNVSMRLDARRVMITPTAVPKRTMTAADAVIVALDGRPLAGRRKPTSEIGLHLQVYRLRPDVGAVVHAHPPTATGFACAGIALDHPIASEFIVALGKAPLASYGMPGSQELADSLEGLIPKHDAVLMGNHGVVAYAKDLETAFGKMQLVEHFAKIVLTAVTLGKQARLTPEQVARLEKAGETYGR